MFIKRKLIYFYIVFLNKFLPLLSQDSYFPPKNDENKNIFQFVSPIATNNETSTSNTDNLLEFDQKEIVNDLSTLIERMLQNTEFFGPTSRIILECIFFIICISLILYTAVKNKKFILLIYRKIKVHTLKTTRAPAKNIEEQKV